MDEIARGVFDWDRHSFVGDEREEAIKRDPSIMNLKTDFPFYESDFRHGDTYPTNEEPSFVKWWRKHGGSMGWKL